ncbi:MAG: UDP-N-acetylmuramate--L-alanine ligase [Actinomycetota bacterium]
MSDRPGQNGGRAKSPSALDDLAPLHLIGIGGAGMSAIARVLLARGVAVSGSDMKDTPGLAALRALGARVFVGHDEASVDGAAAVVVSSAIRETNPELVAARALGLPVMHRAQILSMLMRERRGVAVTGTHGKTTTTSMISLVFERAGLDPSFLIGGDLNERGTNAHSGTGEWLIAEADESDGSFLWLGPEIAVITNIEAEHLDHYRDEAEVRDTFLAFTENVLPDGTVVMCADDPGVQAVLPQVRRGVVTYGLDAGEWRAVREAREGGQRLDVTFHGRSMGSATLSVPGAHNARNALAAFATAATAGIPFERAAIALASFQGVQRRFQLRGLVDGVTVVDDYAHNPTKVRAALDAAREQRPGRVVAVFQPHLYSRTQFFARQLGAALATADVVVVTDVYGAREDPIPGVTGKLVVDGVLEKTPRKRVAYIPKRTEVAAYVASVARAGDFVLTIGAGDVTMLGDEIVRLIGAATSRRAG